MTWRQSAIVLAICLASRGASATAIVLLVAKDGIVLTADSKQLIAGNESRQPIQKVARIGPRAFLASAGPTHIEDDSVTSGGKPWVYDFGVLANDIARRMKGADTSSIAEAVWHESQRTFGPVGAGLAELHQKILFTIVGIDAGVPHAWEVKVMPTRDDLRIEKEEILPSAAGEMWTGNGFAPGDLEGPANLIAEAKGRAGQLFTPAADFDDRTVFAGLLVALRAEHSPRTVGPPIKQVILLRGGRIVERTWTEDLLRPHKRLVGQDQKRAGQ